jgi:hypothetical protein
LYALEKKVSSFDSFQSTDQRLAVLYEQLHWLLLLTGFVLADAGMGETPLIPEAIMTLCSSQPDPLNDPVVKIIKTIFNLLEIFNLQPGNPLVGLMLILSAKKSNPLYQQLGNCSPTVIESLFWFIERWAASYLIFDQSEYPNVSASLMTAFNHPGDGPQLLDYLLEKIHSNAILWTSESNLIHQLVKTLKGFSSSKDMRDRMLTSPKFNDLVLYLLNNLGKLPSTVHSPLIETIATIASHATSVELRAQFFSSLSSTIEVSIFYYK